MPLKQYFCGSLYSLEKKGLSLFGIPQVVQVLPMEERRTDNLFFFNFSTGGNGKISLNEKKNLFTFQLSLR